MKRILASLVLILPMLAEAQLPPRTCRNVFTTPSNLVTPFPISSTFPHTTKYDRVIDSTANIKNQCNLGTCHLHAWATNLENIHFNRTGKTIHLSTRYLAANRVLEAAMKQLGKLENQADNEGKDNWEDWRDDNLALGAHAFGSRSMIHKSGLVPESIWQPKSDFDQGSVAAQFTAMIENVIQRAKFKQDATTGRVSSEAIDEGAAQIQEIFHTFIGPFPEEFEFDGKKFSPQSFAAHYYPEVIEPLITLAAPDRHVMNTREDYYRVVDIDTLEQTAKYLVDRNKGAWLAYYHESAYVDISSGVMSPGAFNLPPYAQPMTREQRRTKPQGNHAVQLVGYELDPATGKVKKWKIQNSWGKNSGDQGIYHMYADYFRLYANGLTFARSAGADLPMPDVVIPTQPKLPFTGYLEKNQ